MRKKVVEINHLEKGYKENKAVNDLNFEVYEGEILGLLGPNGAGKSTTISILSTILKKDSGNIRILGKNLETDIAYIKAHMGIVPQDIAIYEDITAYRNVAFFASLYGIKKSELKSRVEGALEFVGLLDKKDDKPKTFSGGMKRRLNIACAIAHNPTILILDEPTVGIDPQSRNHILSSILKLKQAGTTVIYTTHYMEEVAEIADRIVIMDNGKKIAEGTVTELLEKYKNTRKYILHIDGVKEYDCTSIKTIKGIQKVVVKEDLVEISLDKNCDNFNEIISELVKKDLRIHHMETEEGNLEMIFLDLTGKKLRD